MVYGKWASDVGGEKEDAVALVALSEVDRTCALQVRCLEGSNLNAKRGSEGATKPGDGVDRGSKERNFGSTDCVTTDSRNATSTSGNPSRARISLQPLATSLAASKARVPGITPIQRWSTLASSFPASVKRTGSIDDHSTSRESRCSQMSRPIASKRACIGCSQTGRASRRMRCALGPVRTGQASPVLRTQRGFLGRPQKPVKAPG